MSRYLRSVLVPVLSAVIAIGGVSFAMEAVDPTSGDVPVESSPAPDEPTSSPEPEDSPEPEVSPDPEPEVSPEPEASPEQEVSPEPEVSPEGETPEGEPVDEGSDGESGSKWSADGCPEGFSGNHGQYVSSSDETPKDEAAHSTCGKPVKKDKKDGSDDDSEEGSDG